MIEETIDLPSALIHAGPDAYRCLFFQRTPHTDDARLYEYRRIWVGDPEGDHTLLLAVPPAVGDLVRLTDRAFYRGTSEEDIIEGVFAVVRRGFNLSRLPAAPADQDPQLLHRAPGAHSVTVIVDPVTDQPFPFFADEAPGSEGITGERRRAAFARIAAAVPAPAAAAEGPDGR